MKNYFYISQGTNELKRQGTRYDHHFLKFFYYGYLITRWWGRAMCMGQCKRDLMHLICLNWSLDKMAMTSPTIFGNAFSWMESFVFRLEFHWSLFLRIQLTISQHYFRQWLGAKQAPNHYLNECWPSSATHICSTRRRGVKNGIMSLLHELIDLSWHVIFSARCCLQHCLGCVRQPHRDDDGPHVIQCVLGCGRAGQCHDTSYSHQKQPILQVRYSVSHQIGTLLSYVLFC